MEGGVYSEGKLTGEGANYRGISILSMSGKMYGSLLIESRKEQLVEEQGVFRSGRGCIDQILVLK